MAVVSVHDLMQQALGPILKTILFTIVVPGFVTVGALTFYSEDFPRLDAVLWLGSACSAW
jgi:hypothetical protein